MLLDDSFFDGIDRAPAWAVNRSTRAYDAKLGALSVNFNSLAIHAIPGQKKGDRVIASVEPDLSIFTLSNRAMTNGRRKRLSYRFIKNGEGGLNLTLSGAMRPGDKEKVRYVPVPNPTRFAGALFAHLLRKEGIVIRGGVAKA